MVVSRNCGLSADQLVTIEYAADCPLCHDHSFPVRVTGAVFSIGSTEGVAYVDSEELENHDPAIKLRIRLKTVRDIPRGE
jgi:hypothetical protein